MARHSSNSINQSSHVYGRDKHDDDEINSSKKKNNIVDEKLSTFKLNMQRALRMNQDFVSSSGGTSSSARPGSLVISQKKQLLNNATNELQDSIKIVNQPVRNNKLNLAQTSSSITKKAIFSERKPESHLEDGRKEPKPN